MTIFWLAPKLVVTLDRHKSAGIEWLRPAYSSINGTHDTHDTGLLYCHIVLGRSRRAALQSFAGGCRYVFIGIYCLP